MNNRGGSSRVFQRRSLGRTLVIRIDNHADHEPTFFAENRADLEEACHLAADAPGSVWEMWRRRSKGAIREALERVCHGKCVWCETVVGVEAPPEIDHYRPKSGYYWLMFSWSNMLLSCRACNTQKGSSFPLEDESQRARHPDDDIRRERPLLINPTLEEPGEHIRFQGYSAIGITERGKKTIELLGLNSRGKLVEARRERFGFALALGEWTRLASPGSPYLAMLRDLFQKEERNEGQREWNSR